MDITATGSAFNGSFGLLSAKGQLGAILKVVVHDTDPLWASIFPDREAPVRAGAFSFENWCYGVSWSGPHRGFTLGENALKPLAGNSPGMGRAEAIAPTARAAPNLHALLRDTEQLRDLTGRIVVELEFHYALSINFGERRERSCRRLPEMLGWGRF